MIQSNIILSIVLFTGIITMSSSVLALPSEEEIKGVMTVCGAGRKLTFEGDIKGKIDLWRKAASAGGSGSMSDLAAILATVPEGQQVNIDIYKSYTSCILDLVDKYLNQGNKPVKAERLGGAVDIGIGANELNLQLPNWANGQVFQMGGEDPYFPQILKMARGCESAGIDLCPLEGKSTDRLTALECLDFYRKKLRKDSEAEEFFEIGGYIAALEYFKSSRNDSDLYNKNREILVRLLREKNLTLSLSKIPDFSSSASQGDLISAIKGEIRSKYPTTYQQ